MASSFEKSVKGATKIKAAPPKTKYIEHILVATHAGEAGVGEVFRALQGRLRDSTWTVVFKSLITVHFMIREGSPDVTLAYLARHKNTLAISNFSDGNAMETLLTVHGQAQTQGRNIRHYANYLSERARGYRDTKCDFVRVADGRLEKLSVDKGLLRETESVQYQLVALLRCDVLESEPENEITITVFRMLVRDLLSLFHVLNQAMINLLGHFFEMSKTDAERALTIYRNFSKQTDYVVAYLGVARQYEHYTRVEVPKLKHAPINLGKQLEDYVKDPDFEVNRRQYIAEQEVKKGNKGSASTSKQATNFNHKSDMQSKAATGSTFPGVLSSDGQRSAVETSQPSRNPNSDLIDFFDSIEQNQQPMATQGTAYPQQNDQQVYNPGPNMQMPQQYPQGGFMPQTTAYQSQPQSQPQFFQQQQESPPNAPDFGRNQQQGQQQQIQTNFTGAGFGGYTPQPSFQPTSLSPIPQDSAASFSSIGSQQFNGTPTGQQQNTNPFRQSIMNIQTGAPPQQFSPSPPITAQLTRQSTNPFAKSVTSPPAQQSFTPPAQQPFSPPIDQYQQQQQQQQLPQQTMSPMQAMPTGTNPFARIMSPLSQQQTATGSLASQPTGSTNPFRQSAFVNTATGSGWQNNQLPIGGGLDNLETVPIFPRPAQQPAWQQ